jgi:hypothetical protein
MTLPKADKDLFIYLASSMRSSVFSPSLSLSLPARSISENFEMTLPKSLIEEEQSLT